MARRKNVQNWGHPVKNPKNGKTVAWINTEDSLSEEEFRAIEPVVAKGVCNGSLVVESFSMNSNQPDEDANAMEGLDELLA